MMVDVMTAGMEVECPWLFSSEIYLMILHGKWLKTIAKEIKLGKLKELTFLRTLKTDQKAVGNTFSTWISNIIRIIEFDNYKSATRARRILNGTKLNGREVFA